MSLRFVRVDGILNVQMNTLVPWLHCFNENTVVFVKDDETMHAVHEHLCRCQKKGKLPMNYNSQGYSPMIVHDLNDEETAEQLVGIAQDAEVSSCNVVVAPYEWAGKLDAYGFLNTVMLEMPGQFEDYIRCVETVRSRGMGLALLFVDNHNDVVDENRILVRQIIDNILLKAQHDVPNWMMQMVQPQDNY